MEWYDIATAASGFVLGGGLTALVTLRDRKSGAVLDNLKELIESNDRTNKEWEEIAADRTARAAELKADLDRKDGKIDELFRTVSELKDRLDERNRAVSRLKILKCERIECTRRKPPVGVFRELDEDTRRIQEENDEWERRNGNADNGDAGGGDAAEPGE